MAKNLSLVRFRALSVWDVVVSSAFSDGSDVGKGRASWNDDQIKKLRDMWLSGRLDAELIAEFGRSANAIAIKAHRLGLPPRAEAVATNAASRLPTMAIRRKDAVDYPDQEEHEDKLSRPKAVGRVRGCLMCGVEFWSSHSGERICSSCKSTEFWRNGAAVFGHRGGGEF